MSGKFEEQEDLKMATLPAKSSGRWREKMKSVELTLPREKAPRPTTLPYRTSMSSHDEKSPQDDVNPLKKLREKGFGFAKMRPKNVQIVTNENIPPENYNIDNNHHQDECDVNLESESSNKNTDNKDIDTFNPIPLPPRDKTKITLTKPKRHVRKHPLIIPGTGLQRTLDKVTQKSPTDENFTIQKSLVSNNNYNVHPTKQLESSKLKGFDVGGPTTKQFIENNFPPSSAQSSSLNQRTYQNIEELLLQTDNMDSASLHFESILENVNDFCSHDAVDGIISSGDVGNCFDIQKDCMDKESPTILSADDELRNLDIEKKKIEFSKKHPKYVQPKNELASNVLFNKIKSTVENTGSSAGTSATMSRMRSKSEDAGDEDDEAFLEGDFISTANDVSCEDLLEFANDKPNGRERGVDSDEVRIMSKVLGKSVSTFLYINIIAQTYCI